MRGETAEFVLPFEERCYENATSQERKRADTHGSASYYRVLEVLVGNWTKRPSSLSTAKGIERSYEWG